MKAGGGEHFAPRRWCSRILGVKPGDETRPLRGKNCAPSVVTDWATRPRKRALKRRINEGARLRVAEDKIEA